MGKLTFLGLEHLPSGFAAGTYDKGYGLIHAPFPFRFNTFTSYRDRYWYAQDGWMVSDQTGGNTFAWVNLPADYVMTAAAKRLIMGMRLKNTTGYNLTWSDTTLAMAALGSGVAGGKTTLFSLFNPVDIKLALRTEAYVELDIDLTTGLVKRWANGKPISSVTITGTQLTALQNRAFEFSFQNNQNLCTPQIRDIYFLEVLDEDKLITRLGPVRIKRAALDTAAGNGWTAGKGPTLKDDLISAVNSNTAINAPVIASPEPPTPLQISYNVGSVADTDRIVALALTTGLVKSDSNAATVKASATLDQNSSDFGSAPVGTAFSLQYPFSPLKRAPGNRSWTAARLKQAQFTLLLQRG